MRMRKLITTKQTLISYEDGTALSTRQPRRRLVHRHVARRAERSGAGGGTCTWSLRFSCTVRTCACLAERSGTVRDNDQVTKCVLSAQPRSPSQEPRDMIDLRAPCCSICCQACGGKGGALRLTCWTCWVAPSMCGTACTLTHLIGPPRLQRVAAPGTTERCASTPRRWTEPIKVPSHVSLGGGSFCRRTGGAGPPLDQFAFFCLPALAAASIFLRAVLSVLLCLAARLSCARIRLWRTRGFRMRR